MSAGAARNQLGLALTRAQAFLDPGVLGRDPDRALGPGPFGVHALQPITRQLAEGRKAIRLYPIRKVTTPVPVEGDVAGGALPMSAGSSFHGRRKPKGSACQRRTMAGVQDEAKHAMSAMSPLTSVREWTSPAAFLAALESWLADYNASYLHSALGYRAPNVIEAEHLGHATPLAGDC